MDLLMSQDFSTSLVTVIGDVSVALAHSLKSYRSVSKSNIKEMNKEIIYHFGYLIVFILVDNQNNTWTIFTKRH
jgi:hypothetical protein